MVPTPLSVFQDSAAIRFRTSTSSSRRVTAVSCCRRRPVVRPLRTYAASTCARCDDPRSSGVRRHRRCLRGRLCPLTALLGRPPAGHGADLQLGRCSNRFTVNAAGMPHEGQGKAVRSRRDPVTVIGDETRTCHWPRGREDAGSRTIREPGDLPGTPHTSTGLRGRNRRWLTDRSRGSVNAVTLLGLVGLYQLVAGARFLSRRRAYPSPARL